jgi:hypothetical protein
MISKCHCEPLFGDREAYPQGKQSPAWRIKLAFRRLLQRHKSPLRNDIAISSSIREKTMTPLQKP